MSDPKKTNAVGADPDDSGDDPEDPEGADPDDPAAAPKDREKLSSFEKVSRWLGNKTKAEEMALERADLAATPPPKLLEHETSDGESASGVFWSQTNFENFCRSTSMHGWYFIADDSQPPGPCAVCWKVFWVFVVVISFTTGLYLVALIVNDYRHEKVQSTYIFQRGNWEGANFPGVTVCNVNQVRKSFLIQHGLENKKDLLEDIIKYVYSGGDSDFENASKFVRDNFDIADEGMLASNLYGFHFPDNNASYELFREVNSLPDSESALPKARFGSPDLFRLAAVQTVGLSNILKTSFQGVDLNLDSLASLHPFFDTDYGYCTFVRPPVTFFTSRSTSFPEVLDREATRIASKSRTLRLGRDNGLTMLLDAETFDYGYTFSDFEGFKVSIHNPEDFPHMAFSILDVSPGYAAQMAVEPWLKDTTRGALSFTSKERKCYTDPEIVLTYLTERRFRYSFDNCVVESAYRRIRRQCLCRRTIDPQVYDRRGEESYVPRHWDANGTYVGGPQEELLPEVDPLPSCRGRSLTCLSGIMEEIGNMDSLQSLETELELPCLAACKDEVYHVSLSLSNFPSFNAMLRNHELFCLVFRKLRTICSWEGKFVALKEAYGKEANEFCYEVAKLNGTVPIRAGSPGFNDSIQYFKNLCNKCEKVVLEEYLRPDLIPRQICPDGTIRQDPPDECKEGECEPGNVTCTNCLNRFNRLTAFVYRYAERNLVSIRVFIKDTSVDEVEVDEKQKLVWIFANIGGTLGLASGFSLVTSIEVLYFTALWCLYVQHRLRNKSIQHLQRRKDREARRERKKLRGVLKGMLDYDKSHADDADQGGIAGNKGKGTGGAKQQ